ncbi:RluA family pseudouridine synthase [Treponema sp.]
MKGADVIYENEGILVLNKAAGFAVQGGERVSASLDQALETELGAKVFLVHRLDKDTSGLILVAKNRESAAFYAQLFSDRSLKKSYLAVAAGKIDTRQSFITSPISVKGVQKEALTHYQVLAQNKDYSVIEMDLGTGRMHQLRIHLASLSHPILGDDKYGDFKLNKRLRKERSLRRLLLHARRLLLPSSPFAPHLDLFAPVPEAFLPYLEELGLSTALT